MNTTKPKSSKITAGSIDTEHVSLNLLRANDFVAQKIREQLKDILKKCKRMVFLKELELTKLVFGVLIKKISSIILN